MTMIRKYLQKISRNRKNDPVDLPYSNPLGRPTLFWIR